MQIEDLVVGRKYNIRYTASVVMHSYHGVGTYIKRYDNALYFDIPIQAYNAIFHIEDIASEVNQQQIDNEVAIDYYPTLLTVEEAHNRKPPEMPPPKKEPTTRLIEL